MAQYETEAQMTPIRHRNAWIWVAITAIALASVARAQSGYELARTYANPVIAFLAADHTSQPGAAKHFAQAHAARDAHAGSPYNSNAGDWLQLLPVLFVGLVSPLILLLSRSFLSIGQAYPASALPALFQRPPPAQLL
jgi:hypothetical protein